MGNNGRKLALLLWKNFTLQIRRPIGTFVEFILPIGFLALLLIPRNKIAIREKCAEVQEHDDIKSKTGSLWYYPNSGDRLAYYPVNENTTRLLTSATKNIDRITLVTASVANKNFTTLDDIIFDARNNSGRYLGIITFEKWNKRIEYTIRLQVIKWMYDWNTDKVFPSYIEPGDDNIMYKNIFLLLQYYIDSAIIQMQTGNNSITSPRYIQKFPRHEYLDDSLWITILQQNAPLLFVLAFIYTATMIVKELVAEKQLRLKECMKMMGLPNWVHWLAWFIKSFVVFLVIILLQTLLLKGGGIFKHASVLVTFLTLLIYVVSSICFLFLISVFFFNGTRAMLFTTILWLASYAPTMSFGKPESYDILPTEQKFALCLLPNTCLGVMINIITKYESAQAHLGLGQINIPANAQQDFLLSDAYLMLLLDCVIFLLLTWYIENVFPGEYGIPLPFYFPFKKSYWCGGGIEMNFTGTGETYKNFEEEPTDLEVGVSIKKLRKVFNSATGEKTAVDNVNLNIYKGQITALLGHNGAGKTTTLSILTGLFPPTSGEATVNGKSILTDMDSIRDSFGLCPQYNILFDRLTVKEHLIFFSALKGVPKAAAEEEVIKLITDMQLLDKINQRASTLSGGMKRKLCCAIALVGGSETIFLDEPTSGMDPYARRATWDILQQYRQQKTIILTTHFMDEADYLGDRIAIMVSGQVYCCGSSLYLKKRYGVGYHLTLVKEPSFKESEAHSLICNHIPTAKMVGNVAAELSYVLSEDSTSEFKGLFEKLECEKDSYGISSFGVSVTTMEEVFLKVGEEAERQEKALVNDVIVNEFSDTLNEPRGIIRQLSIPLVENYVLRTGFSLKASQWKAMFVKRFLNSKRKKTAILTQLLLPLVLLVGGLLLVVNIQNRFFSDTPLPSIQLSLSMLKARDSEIVSYYSGKFNSPASDKALLKQVANSYYESVEVIPKDIENQIHNITVGNKDDKVSVLYSNKRNYSGDLKFGRSACCNYQYLVLNEKCDVKTLKDFCNSSMTCFAGTRTLRVNGKWPSNAMQEYILERGGSGDTQFYDRDVAGFTVDDDMSYTVWYSGQAYHTLPSAYSAVSNIILRYTTNDESYGIVTNNHPLPKPFKKEENQGGSPSLFLGLIIVVFVTMASCLLAASFLPFLVTEKVTKAKHIQFVSGVNSICYWGGTLCWDIINFLVPGLGFLIIFAVFDLDGFKGELGTLFLLILLFGMSVLPFVYLLSFLFTGPIAAYAFVASLVMILSLACYLATKFVMMIADTRADGDIMHHVFLLFPTYAFPKALDDLWTNVLQRKKCTESPLAMFECKMQEFQTGQALYQNNTFALELPGVGLHCVYMLVLALVYFTLIILKEEINVRRSKVVPVPVTEDEDIDVQNERRKVDEVSWHGNNDSALLIKDLTKVYRTNGMVAVDHITVDIPKGECFGLLGINGAGKTTTFGMLTGELSITEGKAYLHGMDIQRKLKEVQQIIGYCPQFDALIDTLTGREMLQMFAQLRGVPSHMVNEVVESNIKNLNLTEWADKMSGNYSGGNKRKLSTALALVGNPSVIFLDEPTSGMDPGSRRYLWNTISDVLKTGRSIILTSHSMEECEALCTRLVIMVNGKFKCIGSLQHLKSRFGQGYVVMLKVNTGTADTEHTGATHKGQVMPLGDTESMQRVKDFMREKFPSSLILEEHQGYLQFQVESINTRLSQMFGIFEEHAETLNIVDYSISQTTLDQIFINFAKEQHSEERKKKRTCFSCSCF